MSVLKPQCLGCGLNSTQCAPLSPLSIVGIAVALKLGVRAGLVDGAATLLDLSERPAPVVVTLIVATDPVTERSSVCFEKKWRVGGSFEYPVSSVVHLVCC